MGKGVRIWATTLGRAGLLATILAAAVLGRPIDARAAEPAAEIRCLALTVYYEARAEPVLGQRAVAHVVMNRVEDTRFPNSICEVVRQGGDRRLFGCQFTWWCDGKSDQPREFVQWYDALITALDVYGGASRDPTKGALWYHATYVAPPWTDRLVRLTRIGQHVFYGEAQNIAMSAGLSGQIGSSTFRVWR